MRNYRTGVVRLKLRFTIALLLLALTITAPGKAFGGGKIYWTDQINDTLSVGKSSGSGTSTILFDNPADSLSQPYGIAIDAAGGKVYWSDDNSNRICVGNLNGSGPPTVLFEHDQDGAIMVGPRGIAIDVPGSKIYFATSYGIYVGSLSGIGAPTELFNNTEVFFPLAIAIDVARGKIYWSEGSSQRIQVGNLDGTGSPATVFDYSTGQVVNVFGIALDLAARRIYWSDFGFEDPSIRVGNMDGSGVPVRLFDASDGLFNPKGLALDIEGGKIYWGDGNGGEGLAGGAIIVGNIDGSGTPIKLFDPTDGLQYPIGIALHLYEGGAQTNIEADTDPLPEGATTADFGSGPVPLPFTLTDSAVQVPGGSPDIVVTTTTGTTVTLPEYQVINFPNGSGLKEIQISTPLDPVEFSQLPDLETAILVRRVFGPTGTQFEPPVTITITYTDLEIASVLDESMMIPYLLNPTTHEYEPLDAMFLPSVVIDTVNNTLTFQTDHFSTYSIGGPRAVPLRQQHWLLWIVLLVLATFGAVRIVRRPLNSTRS